MISLHIFSCFQQVCVRLQVVVGLGPVWQMAQVCKAGLLWQLSGAQHRRDRKIFDLPGEWEVGVSQWGSIPVNDEVLATANVRLVDIKPLPDRVMPALRA